MEHISEAKPSWGCRGKIAAEYGYPDVIWEEALTMIIPIGYTHLIFYTHQTSLLGLRMGFLFIHMLPTLYFHCVE